MSNQKSLSGAARAGRRPFRVSIEGNIGSGKSTCIQYFDKFPNVEKHPEPIDEWRNMSGHNLLNLVYSDPHKWTFPFQHQVHLTRLRLQTSPPANPQVTVKMFERSVQNSRFCFVENARRQNLLEEPAYRTLLAWYDYTEQCLDVSLDLIVYLKTTPRVVFERMQSRGREEEAEVPLEYLQEVHEAYERWLRAGAGGAGAGCDVLEVDADRGIAQVCADLDRYAYKILGGNHTN